MLDQLGIADAVFVGTSLGGLCTMLLAATDAERIAGALLNDIGPVIDQAGIDRIGGYVGRTSASPHGTRPSPSSRERNARCLSALGRGRVGALRAPHLPREEGGIRFDYDMAIAENFRARRGRRRSMRGRFIARSTAAR